MSVVVADPANAYAILGVEPGSNEDAIKHAYRRLARQFHPEVSADPEAAQRFNELQQAYSVLKSAARVTSTPMATHDGVEWTGELDFTVLTQEAARVNLDQEVTAQVTLEEAASGVEAEVILVATERDAVTKQIVKVERPTRVRLPPGLVHGERLCVRGLSADGAGDVYVTVTLKKHPIFHTNGHDIFVKLPIAPWEAVLGAILDIPTLQGPVQVRLKPGTGAGQKLRLQGRGLTKPTGGNGDLYCVLRVVTPTQVSEREKALYRELAQLANFAPRAGLRTASGAE